MPSAALTPLQDLHDETTGPELPLPPAVCRWPAPPARVPTYGRRDAAEAGETPGDEYLRNLESLGYL